MDEGQAIMFPLFVLIRRPSNSENSDISWPCDFAALDVCCHLL